MVCDLINNHGGIVLDLSDIAIVLTGTICPNTTLANKRLDFQVRRKEYLKAIHFYRQFGTVYFLENSAYPLYEDQDFQGIPNVFIRKFDVSKFPDRGKGFQEFEMLDAWVNSEENLPTRWIKVTGRYIYENFPIILDECHDNKSINIIINQYLFSKRTDVAIFCTKTKFYQDNILGIYQQCDDKNNHLVIEKIMNQNLANVKKTNFSRFKTYLKCNGIAGWTGKAISNIWLDTVNSNTMRFNYLLDKRYIWISF
jgi:hypothetical protein